MSDSATYMANVPCIYYDIKYNKQYPPKNSFGRNLRHGHPYYSASSDWEWMPVDTIFEFDSKKFTVDGYATNLIGIKSVNLLVTQTNSIQSTNVILLYGSIKILQWGNCEKSSKTLKAEKDNNFFEKIMVNVP